MSPHNRDNRTAQRLTTRRSVVLALVLALTAVVLIFILYEIVERIWLVDTDMQLLRRLHIARGIGSSVVAAVLAGWVIMRNAPPLLASVATEDEWFEQATVGQQKPEVNYASWFIRMRWIAVVVAATFVITCVRIVPLLPGTVLWPLLLTLGVLAGSNVCYMFVSARGVWNRGFLQVQIYSDLVVLMVLLHFSGGIENPLSVIMLLHVIIAGIILTRRQCYMVAVVGGILFGLLALAEATHLVDHYTLEIIPHVASDERVQHAAHEPLYVSVHVVLQSSLLFLVAYFVTAVTQRLRMNEVQLKRMASRALAESQLLERSLDTTGAALRVLGPDLRPRWSNTRWQAWFGGSGSGSSMIERLDGAESAARQTFRDGRTRQTELGADETVACGPEVPGGDPRCFQITTAPLRDAAGNVQQVVELAQDITEQKQTQSQLIRAGQLAAVGELAGQVAHEVNNPIAIIGAKSRLLLSDQRDEMSDSIAEELGKIIDLSDRVARIAQGLLSYCRPSGAARTPLDIRVPVRNALAMIEQPANSAGVRIVTDLSHDLPSVHANQQEMEQVFLNLVLNALDAMPHGGTLTITARHERHPSDGGGAVAVVVEDNGCGVAASARDQVFRPFFTTKKLGRGTGLGLSICQGLIASHGGKITLTSQEGQGTQVTVTLPGATGSGPQGESYGEEADPGRR